LNTLVERGDIFGLLYLRNVLKADKILVDKNPKARGDFLNFLKSNQTEPILQELEEISRIIIGLQKSLRSSK
jgi:hypothetical protein